MERGKLMKYTEMHLVKPTATREGQQETVVMIQEDNAKEFLLVSGKTGACEHRKFKKYFPEDEWDNIVLKYINRGFYVIPGKNAPSNKKVVSFSNNNYAPEKNKTARELIDLLMSMSQMVANKSLSISVSELTKEQLDECKNILTELMENEEHLTDAEVNNYLCHFYAILGKRMKYLGDYLVRSKDRRGKPLSKEKARKLREELLNKVMDDFSNIVNLQQITSGSIYNQKKSITESFNTEIVPVTAQEEDWLIKKINPQRYSYSRAWKIINHSTEESFNKFVTDNNLTLDNGGIKYLFHGSRGENWLSIVLGGLKTVPYNIFSKVMAKICGKAYGLGIYFAPDAVKSEGYMDTVGAKWNGGSNQVGYLGIFKVAVGKKDTRYKGDRGCDSSLNFEKLQSIKPDALCTWAESRYSGFMMDEVIVYNDCQATIAYLVELSA